MRNLISRFKKAGDPQAHTRDVIHYLPKRRLLHLFAIATLVPVTASAQTFNDVPTDFWAYDYIETLYESGITSGCGAGNYCPADPVTRAQMAVFLERGMHGSDYVPEPAIGNVFTDVGPGDFAANFIEQLYSDGITAGCGNNSYCPDAEVSRAQMAVFLLRAKYGSGFSPPTAIGAFNDVDLSHWAVHWIEALADEGITSGCGNGNYCPENLVTRAEMAVFLVRAFGLDKANAPTNLTISNITSSSATMSWTDNSNNETGFQVGFCTGLVSAGSNGILSCMPGFSPGSGFVQIDQVSANVTSYTFTGLSANTQYSRFVRAYNAAGSSANTGVSFITDVGQQTVTLQAVASNLVMSNSLDNSWANTAYPNTYPAVGIQWAWSAWGYPSSLAFAGLVKFDISTLQGKTIDSAILNLEANSAPVGYYPQDFDIGTVATSWSASTVSWNQVAYFQYYTAGWQRSLSYPLYTGQTYSLNLTPTVQNWADGTFANNGLGFFSSNYSVFPGNTTSFDQYDFIVPTLTVTYR